MANPTQAPFGSLYHDEMVLSHYDGQWQQPVWQPSNALTLHPGAHVFHYGSACFEGLKAFRHADGRLAIFRLDDHVARMCSSAERLYMPIPDRALLRNMIIDITARARTVIPEVPGSLYLRPTLIGTEPQIGKATTPSATALLYILASPVGDYYTPGSPLKVLVESKHQRCAPHMGSIKSGGNYASALHWQMQAKIQHHAQQVLYCPEDDVQETGAANFILLDGDDIITKPLSSEFLHGITRRSILTLAAEQGYRVREENFTIETLYNAVKGGAEAILTGTAAVIAPITEFVFGDETIEVSKHDKSLALRKAVTDIQFGYSDDKHHWLTFVDEK